MTCVCDTAVGPVWICHVHGRCARTGAPAAPNRVTAKVVFYGPDYAHSLMCGLGARSEPRCKVCGQPDWTVVHIDKRVRAFHCFESEETSK